MTLSDYYSRLAPFVPPAQRAAPPRSSTNFPATAKAPANDSPHSAQTPLSVGRKRSRPADAASVESERRGKRRAELTAARTLLDHRERRTAEWSAPPPKQTFIPEPNTTARKRYDFFEKALRRRVDPRHSGALKTHITEYLASASNAKLRLIREMLDKMDSHGVLHSKPDVWLVTLGNGQPPTTTKRGRPKKYALPEEQEMLAFDDNEDDVARLLKEGCMPIVIAGRRLTPLDSEPMPTPDDYIKAASAVKPKVFVIEGNLSSKDKDSEKPRLVPLSELGDIFDTTNADPTIFRNFLDLPNVFPRSFVPNVIKNEDLVQKVTPKGGGTFSKKEFFIAASPGATSFTHIDKAGYSTWIVPIQGLKTWLIPRAPDTATAWSMLGSTGPADPFTLAQIIAFNLFGFVTFMQPPGQPHAVRGGPDESQFCVGGHVLTRATYHSSVNVLAKTMFDPDIAPFCNEDWDAEDFEVHERVCSRVYDETLLSPEDRGRVIPAVSQWLAAWDRHSKMAAKKLEPRFEWELVQSVRRAAATLYQTCVKVMEEHNRIMETSSDDLQS